MKASVFNQKHLRVLKQCCARGCFGTKRKRGACLASWLILLSALGAASSAASLGAQAQGASDPLFRRTVPLPTDAPGGLAWDGSEMWVIDWERWKAIRFDPLSGRPSRSLQAPCLRPVGLDWSDGLLFFTCQDGGQIVAVETETGAAPLALPSPNGEAAGVSPSDSGVWICDPADGTIKMLTRDDGAIARILDAPWPDPGALSFDGHLLWVAQPGRSRIYCLDPSSGRLLTGFRSPGPQPCGLVAAGNRLWVADFETGLLYECAPRDLSGPRLWDWRKTWVRYRVRLSCSGPGEARDIKVFVAIPPDDLPNQMSHTGPVFDPEPAKIVQDRWGQGVAVFERASLLPGEVFEVGYTMELSIANAEWVLFPQSAGRIDEIPADLLEQYTADGSRLCLGSQVVKQAAREAGAGDVNAYLLALNIFDWVRAHMEYELTGGWDTAETLIRRGTGSCSEYTFLFIALCRANGLPARYQAGCTVTRKGAAVDRVHHRWAQVFLPGYGWVPFDPAAGDRDQPGASLDAIGRLSNRHFITTVGGGDSEALGWTYNSRTQYTPVGRATIQEDEWVTIRQAKREGEEPPLPPALSATGGPDR